MAKQVQASIAYLLDTESTSESSFEQALLQNNEIYHERNRSILQTIINDKLKQWKDADQREKSATINRMAAKANDDGTSKDESSSDESDSDEQASVHVKRHRASKVSTACIYTLPQM